DKYPSSALEQLQERGVTYPSLADTIGESSETIEFARTSRSMPLTYFIDADGSIAYEHLGVLTSEDELVDLVREHLGVDL
uniref:TlpA family protein disulfide reductase n=1 Tax=Stenotrophomonas maltophilia TaxID=40324 RepID=UPI0034DB0084